MFADARVFAREPFHFGVGEVSTEAHVQFAGEVVVEFGEEFDVEEEHGGRRELVGYDVEENLGTEVLVLLGGALLGADGEETHLEEVGTVSEEDALAGFGGLISLGRPEEGGGEGGNTGS